VGCDRRRRRQCGLCAALAAQEAGGKVLVLERASEEESGGNSRFTAGLMRIAYNGVDDLRPLIDLSEDEVARSDFGAYTEEQFFDDMGRVTEYRCDPDLTEILVKQSHPTVSWMRKKGVRFTAAWGRQAFNVDGRFKFWGGLTLEAVGGGPGWSIRSRRSRRSTASRCGTTRARFRSSPTTTVSTA
jgi:tricarballylate dehydrogenase